MHQRKPNISRWYLLGLAAVLTAGCLVISVGTALARYRVENEKDILFQPREAKAVTLGLVDESGVFAPADSIAWQTVTDEEGKQNLTLDFAVSNYVSETEVLKEDLTFRVRLVGTLSAWNLEQTNTPFLTDGTMVKTQADDGSGETETLKTYSATVMEIPEDTALYHSFGVGWVFLFLDENGQELTWTLEGGTLNCVEMNITLDAGALNGTSLLQLQIAAE